MYNGIYQYNICYNHILHYSISRLKNLQILDISHNYLFDKLPDDMFTSLQSLRELDISWCRLSTLPKRYVLYIQFNIITIVYIM